MSICLNGTCGNPTATRFCSRSCSATYHNRLRPRRKVEGTCRQCLTPIPTSKRYCSEDCKVKARDAARQTPEEFAFGNKRKVIEWRQRLKIKAILYKGGSCYICGYNKSIRAMIFHHLDPTKKDFGIGSGSCKAWSRVKLELDKCVLLCCRCHAEVHDGLIILPDLANLAPGAGLEPAMKRD